MFNKSKEWIDYYKILQIDPMAEQEIVESAYKKLANKYHPDKSRAQNATEIMTTINMAYDTLKDEFMRSQYDIKWLERQKITDELSYKKLSAIDEMLIYAANEIIDAYFLALKNRRFNDAYKLISSADKIAISVEDFTRWQRSVSRVYKIIKYETIAEQCLKRKTLHKNSYEFVAAYKVKILEVNTIMKRNEVDEFTKYVVFEEGNWKIYVGHGSVHELISRYERLSQIGRKRVFFILKSNEYLSLHKNCLKKNALVNRIDLELERYNRYGNIFSIVVFKVIIVSSPGVLLNISHRQKSIDILLKDITTSIRKLDSVGFWSEDSIAVLLPESDLKAAMKFKDKILDLVEVSKENHHTYKVKSVVIENDYHQIEDLLKAIEIDRDDTS